jgi:hypothetical protein
MFATSPASGERGYMFYVQTEARCVAYRAFDGRVHLVHLSAEKATGCSASEGTSVPR